MHSVLALAILGACTSPDESTTPSPVDTGLVTPPAPSICEVGSGIGGLWGGGPPHTFCGDVLPAECPFGGSSAQWVWAGLRELQVEYRDREPGWRDVPGEFERLARGLHALLALGA